MKIVGTGCGPGLLTEEAKDVISGSKLIFGSKRAIDLVRHVIPAGCDVREIRDYRNLTALPPDAVVLSTGDPMLAGLGYLPGEIVPGISSLQLAAARLHIPLSRCVVVVAHGRDHAPALEETAGELARKKIVYLVPDPKFDIGKLTDLLSSRQLAVKIALCEELGYPGERITFGTQENPPVPESDLFSLVVGEF
jgi:cobalt-precorrin-7 (C5)-methyltransferase